MEMRDPNIWLDRRQQIALNREALFISSLQNSEQESTTAKVSPLDTPLIEKSNRSVSTVGGEDTPLTIITTEDVTQQVSDDPETRQTKRFTFEQDSEGQYCVLELHLSQGGTLPPAIRGSLTVAAEETPSSPYITDTFQFIAATPLSADRKRFSELGWQIGEAFIDSGWQGSQTLLSETQTRRDIAISHLDLTSERRSAGSSLYSHSPPSERAMNITNPSYQSRVNGAYIDDATDFGSFLEEVVLQEFAHESLDLEGALDHPSEAPLFQRSLFQSVDIVTAGEFVDVVFSFEDLHGKPLTVQFSVSVEPEDRGGMNPFLADIRIFGPGNRFLRQSYTVEFSPFELPLHRSEQNQEFYQELFRSIREHCEQIDRTSLRESPIVQDALGTHWVKPGNIATFLRELYHRMRGR
jgi:hypothetical protein